MHHPSEPSIRSTDPPAVPGGGSPPSDAGRRPWIAAAVIIVLLAAIFAVVLSTGTDERSTDRSASAEERAPEVPMTVDPPTSTTRPGITPDIQAEIESYMVTPFSPAAPDDRVMGTFLPDDDEAASLWYLEADDVTRVDDVAYPDGPYGIECIPPGTKALITNADAHHRRWVSQDAVAEVEVGIIDLGTPERARYAVALRSTRAFAECQLQTAMPAQLFVTPISGRISEEVALTDRGNAARYIVTTGGTPCNAALGWRQVGRYLTVFHLFSCDGVTELDHGAALWLLDIVTDKIEG